MWLMIKWLQHHFTFFFPKWLTLMITKVQILTVGRRRCDNNVDWCRFPLLTKTMGENKWILELTLVWSNHSTNAYLVTVSTTDPYPLIPTLCTRIPHKLNQEKQEIPPSTLILALCNGPLEFQIREQRCRDNPHSALTFRSGGSDITLCCRRSEGRSWSPETAVSGRFTVFFFLSINAGINFEEKKQKT